MPDTALPFSLSAKDHKITFILRCILEIIKIGKMKWNQITTKYFYPIYINIYVYRPDRYSAKQILKI